MYRLTNDDSSQEKSTLVCKDVDNVEKDGKRLNKPGKCRSRISKVEGSLDYGADADGDQQGQGAPTSREEKVSSLKTVSCLDLDFLNLLYNLCFTMAIVVAIDIKKVSEPIVFAVVVVVYGLS